MAVDYIFFTSRDIMLTS